MEGYLFYLLQVVKYAVAILLLIMIACAPAYLAAQTKKDKTNMAMVRLAGWMFGWTIIGWLWALLWASKK